uniref:Tr-type G domain-containing protein n=1 Tax=Macrostomum lignano TaxID=282301 RepID=A0A1I8FLK7_9PLAT
MIHLCGRCERLLRSLQFAFKPLHRLFSKPASKPAPLDLSKFDTSLIRNFSIIAHVDHGKSTLSDRLLERHPGRSPEPAGAGPAENRERDRGITIKAQTVALFYQSPSTGSTYLLNLVDTPGHVDFSHEVHRSVAASDGVVLLVDANDGVQAQTIANYFLAFTAELPIIPVINKIDLPNAKPDEVKKQLQSLFGIEPDQVIEVSAKKAINIDQLLEAIVHRIPPPSTADQADHRSSSFKGLIVDSWFEPYKGAVCLVAAKSGLLKPGDEFRSLHQPKIAHTVKEVGVFRPEPQPIDSLSCGLVGYLISSMRSTREALVGDTVVGGGGFEVMKIPKTRPLTPFQPAQPILVFYGGPVFPGVPRGQSTASRRPCPSSRLNDASVLRVGVARTRNPALGRGLAAWLPRPACTWTSFRSACEEEYNADVCTLAALFDVTQPIRDAARLGVAEHFERPLCRAIRHHPERQVSGCCVAQLCWSSRGQHPQPVLHRFRSHPLLEAPPAAQREIVIDLVDVLKNSQFPANASLSTTRRPAGQSCQPPPGHDP